MLLLKHRVLARTLLRRTKTERAADLTLPPRRVSGAAGKGMGMGEGEGEGEQDGSRRGGEQDGMCYRNRGVLICC